MNCLCRCVLVALTVIVAAAPGFAAEYRFDLTDVVGPSGDCIGDCSFDLGTQFSRINSADLLIRGVFEPGSVIRFGGIPGEFSTGVFQESFDRVSWSVRLGDDAWPGIIGNSKSFIGVDGDFEFQVGLGDIPSLDSAWFLLLYGPPEFPVDPAKFAFLHDGKGQLSSFTMYGWVDNVPETPVLHFDEITLILHGVAVPEPSAAVMGSLLLLASAGLRPCRAFLR